MSLTNTQYDSIIRIYNQKQLKALRENSDRIELINSTLPKYKELGDEIASLALQAAKSRIMGNEADVISINNQIDLLSKEKENVLINAGYSKDFLVPSYECKDCKDTGYIGNEKCHCFKQAIISLLYSQSNIENSLNENNFKSLSYDYYKADDLERFESAVLACHKFVDNFNNDYQNLLFYGTVGTGKSFLSGCVAKEILDLGKSVIYFSAIELFEVLSDVMFGKGEQEELRSVRSDLYECDLLIIDDLGTELTNNAVATQIFSLLNERHLLKKSTVISTNLSLEGLRDRYEDRIFSRIAERYSIFKITGPDIRRIRRNAK